jgi:glycosyltransferase involved in cell wall biosynthesis
MPDTAFDSRQIARQRVAESENMASIDISVVVPTYRRPDLLQRCLAGLLAQDIAPNRFEIIVCDDGPDAATQKLVETTALCVGDRGPHVEYIAVTATQGPAGARNCGWRRARAPVIAFTDDDTIPDAGWLREGWHAMKPGISAAAGRIEVPLPAAPTDYELDAAGLARAEFATANCFVRKCVLERIGGFDERYTSAWREDSDLQFAILAADGIIVRADTAVIVHPVRAGRWAISISQQRKSRFDALLRRKYPALYKQRIRRSPPWLYYAIVSCLAIGLSGLARGEGAMALAGCAGWLVLTGVFAARRLRHTAHTASHVMEMLWTSIIIPPLSVFWRIHGALTFGMRL